MGCLKGISHLSICELAAIASSTAILLSQGIANDDLETLGNLVSTIGSMIMTFATSECVKDADERLEDKYNVNEQLRRSNEQQANLISDTIKNSKTKGES